MNNNIMMIAQGDHPYYQDLCKHFKVKSIDEALNTYEPTDLIIDLSAFRTQKKFLFLKELAKTSKANIISDLTLCWGEWIFKYVPQVTGALSTHFFSPQDAFEYSLKNVADLESKKVILDLSQKIGKTAIEHKNLGLAFHYPRAISMIINEAYFSLEENLASEEAIDLAMKNGVNYPLGPIEWSEKIGLLNIAQLLEELHTITRDDRYRLSKELKLRAFKNL